MTAKKDIESNKKYKRPSTFSFKNFLVVIIIAIVIFATYRSFERKKTAPNALRSRNPVKSPSKAANQSTSPKEAEVIDKYESAEDKAVSGGLINTEAVPLIEINSTDEGSSSVNESIEKEFESTNEEHGSLNGKIKLFGTPAPFSLMIIRNGTKVFTLDPTMPESELKYLADTNDSFGNNYQLSNGTLYFNGSYAIKQVDIVSNTVSPANLPNSTLYNFVIKKPDLNSIIYTTTSIDNPSFGAGTKVIRHCKLDEDKTVIQDYKHSCKNSSPEVLAQFSDGSKVFYHCFLDGQVYLKDLSDPEKEDELIFTQNNIKKLFVPPDNTKVIVISSDNQWTLIDISSPDTQVRIHKVNFNVDMSSIEASSFTEDQKTLYIMKRSNSSEPKFELIAIDFNQLLNSVVSGESYIVLPESQREILSDP